MIVCQHRLAMRTPSLLPVAGWGVDFSACLAFRIFSHTIIIKIKKGSVKTLWHYFTNGFKSGGVQPTGLSTLPSSRFRTLPVSLSILAKLVRMTSFQPPSPSKPAL